MKREIETLEKIGKRVTPETKIATPKEIAPLNLLMTLIFITSCQESNLES